MKVFLAGASGVIGPPLISRLVESGHEVCAMTRSEDKARRLREREPGWKPRHPTWRSGFEEALGR